MADKIKLTPSELQSQASEMKALEQEYSVLFSGVTSELNKTNNNWSTKLANNFIGKINSAQSTFSQLTDDLSNGAQVANVCAVTFESVDSQLAKIYSGEMDAGNKSAPSFLDALKEEFEGIPEDIKTAGEALKWLEEKYGELPNWVTHGADVFVPSSLKKAYILTSGIIQGDLTLNDVWSTAKSIVKGKTKLAVVCESIDYALKTGMERNAEMEAEIDNQLREGDILGAGIDAAEGFIDTVIGGSVEVLGKVGGGALDHLLDKPVLKGMNKAVEYGTGLLGWNDNDGYSIGGLIGAGTEKVSQGIDIVTDFATDSLNYVTDAVTDTAKAGINWVKSWFN